MSFRRMGLLFFLMSAILFSSACGLATTQTDMDRFVLENVGGDIIMIAGGLYFICDNDGLLFIRVFPGIWGGSYINYFKRVPDTSCVSEDK
jgi:hypothetical protein